MVLGALGAGGGGGGGGIIGVDGEAVCGGVESVSVLGFIPLRYFFVFWVSGFRWWLVGLLGLLFSDLLCYVMPAITLDVLYLYIYIYVT